jgi:hypothetical protein
MVVAYNVGAKNPTILKSFYDETKNKFSKYFLNTIDGDLIYQTLVIIEVLEINHPTGKFTINGEGYCPL